MATARRRLSITMPRGPLVRAGMIAVLVLVLIAVVVLALKWRSISSRLFGSNFVGGQAGSAQLHLPPGFSASVYAAGLHAPRFMVFGPDGALYVADSDAGDIVRLTSSGSGQPAPATVVVSDLDNPTSLAFGPDGELYIGEQSRVTLVRFDAHGGVASRTAIIPLPSGGNHITRTVLLGLDDRLYVSIGSTCNNCVETDPHRAAVWVYAPDGSGGRRFVSGMRNAVGMAINPWNGQIWVTDMGRDYLGDNTPPDTIDALRDGGNYGWPVCQAGTIVDPDLG
ncbi:MAG TPA: PQQ-dependent sugar dehydrogenase, partial [Ktedonobacterales bacterium]